ncbi:FBLN5 protein, partial [Amia calva]|nr:FBLN5 protein [Amia calva]
SAGGRCHGLRRLENGRTFFRYGGLFVTFTCNPGFRVHGYQTSSCVSGRWTRDPPVCVGSGCPNPGGILHGSSTMNPDRSFIFFICDKGYRLFGAPLLYCRGRGWNGTKPVCKESDMMSSDKHKHLAQLRANLAQNLNAPSALKNLFRVQYDSIVNSASKDVVLEPELLVESPRATNIKPRHQAGALRQLTVRSRVPEVNDKGIYVDKQHQSGRATVGGRAGAKEAYKEPGSFEKSLFKLSSLQTSPTSPLSTASTLADKLVTTTLQLAKVTVPWDKVFIRSTVQIPAYPLITEHAGKIYYVAPTSRSPSFTALLAPLRRYGTTDQTLVIPEPSSESLSSASTREPQLHIPEKVPIVIQAAPQTLNAQSLTPSSLPTVPATSLDTPVTAEALRQVAETSEVPGPVPSAPHHNLVEIRPDDPPPLGSLKRRPVCPYPPLPAHGTFFFRTVPNPAPLQYKHYVQYSCYAGYTLAHGDVYSYCLHSGKWSGVTPACLEVTPCSINNGGCSQICKLGLLGRAECSCREGFELLEDNSTCRDVDECADELHRCQQACVNTFGSYECGCGPSYLLSEDERSCSDVDECQLPIGTAGCLFGCINTPGSFRCHCPEGYRLGTAHGHCIDIDECEEPTWHQRRCEWKCVNLPGSHRCICPRGFRLGSDAYHCQDINECESKNGGCSHICINHKGGYRCACPELHRFSPYSRKKCQPVK